MNDTTKFEEFWDIIDRLNASEIRKRFPEYTDKLLLLVIAKNLEDETFEIGISGQGDNNWSIVSYNQLDTDKDLSLRFDGKVFDLYFSFYDEGVEDYVSVSEKLSGDRLMIIPKGLQSLMKTALERDKALVVNKNVIER